MDGELEQVGDRWRLRYVRKLPHPPAKVWRALTEDEHLEAWFPCEIHGERKANAELHFVFAKAPVDVPPIEGRMLTYDEPRTLEFTWGGDVLRFDLEPDGDACILTLLDTLEEVGKAARDGAGWHACLDELDYHLRGERPPWPEGSRWQQVKDGYLERFPAEAATIGPPEGMATS